VTATNRSDKRAKADFYRTPDYICEKMVDLAIYEIYQRRLHLWGDRESNMRLSVLEPSSGDGAFLAALAERFGPIGSIQGVEPFESISHRSLIRIIDAISVDKMHQVPKVFKGNLEDFQGQRFDLVIGNPPFKHATEHIAKILRGLLYEGGDLYFLLRLGFTGSRGRFQFFQEYPPVEITMLSYRPSFTADGLTDMSEYAVFHWIKGHTGGTHFSWADWQPPKVTT